MCGRYGDQGMLLPPRSPPPPGPHLPRRLKEALMPSRATREALSEHRGIAGHTVLAPVFLSQGPQGASGSISGSTVVSRVGRGRGVRSSADAQILTAGTGPPSVGDHEELVSGPRHRPRPRGTKHRAARPGRCLSLVGGCSQEQARFLGNEDSPQRRRCLEGLVDEAAGDLGGEPTGWGGGTSAASVKATSSTHGKTPPSALFPVPVCTPVPI